MAHLPTHIDRALALDIVQNRTNHLSAVMKAQAHAKERGMSPAKRDTLDAWHKILHSPVKMEVLKAFGLGFGVDIENSAGRVWANAYDSRHPLPVERLVEARFLPIQKVQVNQSGERQLISPEDYIKLTDRQGDMVDVKGMDPEHFKQAIAQHRQHQLRENGPLMQMITMNTQEGAQKKVPVMTGRFISVAGEHLYVGKGEVHEGQIRYACDNNQTLHQNPKLGAYAVTEAGAVAQKWSKTPVAALQLSLVKEPRSKSQEPPLPVQSHSQKPR